MNEVRDPKEQTPTLTPFAMAPTGEPQEEEVREAGGPGDGAVQGRREAEPEVQGTVRVTDKRKTAVDIRPKLDPVTEFLSDVQTFVVSHPFWPHLLSLPKPVRKQLGTQLGKVTTRFPTRRAVATQMERAAKQPAIQESMVKADETQT